MKVKLLVSFIVVTVVFLVLLNHKAQAKTNCIIFGIREISNPTTHPRLTYMAEITTEEDEIDSILVTYNVYKDFQKSIGKDAPYIVNLYENKNGKYDLKTDE